MNRDLKLLTVSHALWGVGEGLFLTLQPLYIQELGANPGQVGGVLSVLALASGLTYIPSGLLGDRLPRKPLMIGAWLCGPVGVLICVLAQTWQALIPGLAVYGFSAFAGPITNAYLVRRAGGRDPERVLSNVVAAYAAGSVLSPTLAGWLAGSVNMQIVYLLALGVFVLSAVAVACVSPQLPSGRTGWRVDWRLLLDVRFVKFVTVAAWSSFAMYLVFPLAPNYLANVRGLNAPQVGAISSVGAAGMAVITLLLGRFRIGKRPWAWLLGQSLVWASAALLLWAPGVAGIALAYVLRGGYLACWPLMQAKAGRLLGEANQGLALGTALTAMSGAQVLASVSAGLLYGIHPAWPFLAALVAIPVGLCLVARMTEGEKALGPATSGTGH